MSTISQRSPNTQRTSSPQRSSHRRHAAPGTDTTADAPTNLDNGPLPMDSSAALTQDGRKSVRVRRGALKRWVGAVLLIFAFGAAAWGAKRIWNAPHGADQTQMVFHEVSRGTLKIDVSERGNLESQENVKVFCEVDDFRRDGINGTPIIWIAENGRSVSKGDLIVELDSSPVREELDEQTLETRQAEELFLLAQARHENQITQNQTDEEEAQLQLALAELDLTMFQDDSNGTHKLEVEEIKRGIDDLNNEILAAQANLELKQNSRDGIESLFKLGYAGKSEVKRSRLDYLQAESQYAAKINRMKTQLASLSKKQTYEREMETLKLQGKVDTAKRSLQQVIQNNKAALVQAKASMDARKEMLDKEKERLALYQKQYDKCKIYAPSEGMIAYASSRTVEIRQGAPARLRQEILSIPNLKRMQVKTYVHESVLDQIQPNLRATVTVEAFDQSYPARVKSVAVLPSQSGNYYSDSKVYETIVEIDREVAQLKPGMTAVVEIHVDKLESVVAVPEQAIVQQGKKIFCFVRTPEGEIQRRDVEVGLSNELDIHVRSGLSVGEQLVLNPDVVLDQTSDEPTGPSSKPSTSRNAKKQRGESPSPSDNQPGN